MDRVLDLFLEALKPVIGWTWNSIIFWRILALGELVLLFSVLFRRGPFHSWITRDRIRDHDSALLQKAEELMREEDLDSFLGTLVGDHSYWSSHSRIIFGFVDFLQKERNRFLHRRLRKKALDVAGKLHNLLVFTAKHFFRFPDHQTDDDSRYCLYPEFNIDRAASVSSQDQDFYERHAEQVCNLAEAVHHAYVDFRRECKRSLFI
jgi:hypothetical protein